MARVVVQDQPNQTLAKGILVLESFTSEHPEWGIRQLARELGINPATVYRLVATLHNAGYLEKDEETQRYRLGPRVMKPAAYYAHENPLPDIGRSVFESFADRFEYNFYFGTLSRRFEVVYLAVLDSRGPIKIVVEPGGSISLHSTALGKTLLAYQDHDYIAEFLESQLLARYTPRSITDPQQIWDQLRQIRHDGFAVNDGERFDEVAAVGVPVFGRDGLVKSAVSLAYPRHLSGIPSLQVNRLVQLAREVAEEIALRHEGVRSPERSHPTLIRPARTSDDRRT
jgi:DNA-binding IclR family transcriptional regulator